MSIWQDQYWNHLQANIIAQKVELKTKKPIYLEDEFESWKWIISFKGIQNSCHHCMSLREHITQPTNLTIYWRRLFQPYESSSQGNKGVICCSIVVSKKKQQTRRKRKCSCKRGSSYSESLFVKCFSEVLHYVKQHSSKVRRHSCGPAWCFIVCSRNRNRKKKIIARSTSSHGVK